MADYWLVEWASLVVAWFLQFIRCNSPHTSLFFWTFITLAHPSSGSIIQSHIVIQVSCLQRRDVYVICMRSNISFVKCSAILTDSSAAPAPWHLKHITFSLHPTLRCTTCTALHCMIWTSGNRKRIPAPMWLQAGGPKRHSDVQLQSGENLSNLKRKYKQSLCLYCAG